MDKTSNRRILGSGLLLFLVCVTPWLFGGALPIHQRGILVGLMVCWLFILASSWREGGLQIPKKYLWLLLGCGIGIAQLIPLDSRLHQRITPTAASWYRAANPNAPDVAHPISVSATATRTNLAMLAIPVTTVALTTCILRQSDQISASFGVIAINGALFSLFGIIQSLTFKGQLYWRFELEQGGEPFAAFVNRNHAGAYLNLCFAASLGFLIWVERRQRSRLNWFDQISHAQQRWLTYGTSVLIAAGVACTLSRGAILAFAGAAFVTTVMVAELRTNRLVVRAVILATALGLGAAILLGKSELLSERFGEIGSTETEGIYSRPQHWLEVAAAIPDYATTGSGLGTYRYAYRPYERRFVSGWYRHAENQYLEALIEAGVFGLLVLLVAAGMTFKCALTHCRDQSSSTAMGIGAACLFAISSQTIHAFFDFNQYMPAVGMLFALLVGVAWIGRSAASESRFSSISTISALLTVAWVAWSIQELNHATMLDRVLRNVSQLDRAGPINLPIAERYANQLKDMMREPEDASVELQKSVLLFDLFRSHLVEGLSTGLVDESHLWRSTEPRAMHERYYQLAQRGQSFSVVSNSTASLEYLQPSFQAAQAAIASNPLMSSGHQQVATLAPLAGQPQIEAHFADLAVQSQPFNPQTLFEVGLLDLQAKRTEIGRSRWQSSLQLSSRYADEIIPMSLSRMTLAEFARDIMPTDPMRAADLVRRYFDDERSAELRLVLGEQLATLDTSRLSEADRFYFQATVLDLQQDLVGAVSALTDAVDRNPRRVAWRFMLARLHQELGNWQAARKHAQICVQLAPKNRTFARFLLDVESNLQRTHSN